MPRQFKVAAPEPVRLARRPGVIIEPVAKITIELSDELMREVAGLAREGQVTEEEVFHEAVGRLLQAHRGPGIPRFARRLGPLALPEEDDSPTP
jgi:hypothetical protein